MESSGWIAIVDDDPSVLKALTRSFRHRGIRARAFGSAEEFLEALRNGLPGCLILDLQMPGMSGLELLHHLMRENVRVPTIVITAHGDARIRERCESAGAVAYLSKPFRNSSLMDAVDAALGRKRNSDNSPGEPWS
jgi:FixJ family two-component response regulator